MADSVSDILAKTSATFEPVPSIVVAAQPTTATVATQSARVTFANPQSIASGPTPTKLTFDSVEFDAGGLWDSSNHRFNIQLAGKYVISVGCVWDFNTTGSRGVFLKKNGSLYIASNATSSAGGSFSTDLSASDIYDFAAGDYLEAYAAQTSGGALNVLALDRSHLSLARIGT